MTNNQYDLIKKIIDNEEDILYLLKVKNILENKM